MKIQHKKYPKIGQFKDVCYEVRRKAGFAGLDDNGDPIYKDPGKLPTLIFEGTVKLHGTNAAVRWDRIDDMWQTSYQSRNNMITPEKDNAGFAAWATERHIQLMELAAAKYFMSASESIVIFGEFCGGNIQKGVGICELEKMFVIFGMQVDGEWVELPIRQLPAELGLYYIDDFPTWTKVIDFNYPEQSSNEILELVNQVEEECPVAKKLGVHRGTGEGIVWKCQDPAWSDLMFKTKGEKHSKSKVKTLSPVDLEKIEKVRALALTIMTQERCQQGLDYLTEMQLDHSRKNTVAYLKQVVGDCMVEERLTIDESGVDPKLLGKQLSQVAKDWFFDRV